MNRKVESMTKGKDVIIVGAGVTGCSIAYHLARRGISSLLIERESIGARASGKAWGRIEYPHELLLAEREPKGLYYAPPEKGVRHWLDLFWCSYVQLAEIARDIRAKAGVDIEYAAAPLHLSLSARRGAQG